MYMPKLKAKTPATGRLLRIGLGVFLLALFGYAMIPGMFFSQASVGRVNADLVTLRAPIDGQISFADAKIGARVARGQTLAVLRDPPERDVRLANLQAQSAALSERIGGLEQQIAALEPFLQRLGGDSRNFRAAVINSLAAQVAEAEARVRQAEANSKLLDAQFKRIEPLAEKGYASRADFDRRRAEADVAQADLAAQRKTLDRLRQERESAEKGIYLSDSYNNAPYSQQRRDEVELQRLTLVNRRAELEAERAQVERQIEAEQRRRQQMGEAVISAPVDGVLWRQLESEGATIGTSTPLLQVADCSRIFFEVLRDRRADETLSIGDSAIVEFERNGQMVNHKARLVGMRGDQDGDRREFAISSTGNADQLRWVFAVDFASGTRADNPQTAVVQPEACPIGRAGRLHLSDGITDRLTQRIRNLLTSH
jgi:multidrug resistance efflux pump